jgi:hypothetical protein
MTFRINDSHGLSLLAPFRVTGSRAYLPKRLGPWVFFGDISSVAACCGSWSSSSGR